MWVLITLHAKKLLFFYRKIVYTYKESDSMVGGEYEKGTKFVTNPLW